MICSGAKLPSDAKSQSEHAVVYNTVSPSVTITAPEACLPTSPVSIVMLRLPYGRVRLVGDGAAVDDADDRAVMPRRRRGRPDDDDEVVVVVVVVVAVVGGTRNGDVRRR